MCVNIKRVDYLTQLVTTPVSRDWPAKHLGKNTDKRLLVSDFVIKVTMKTGKELVITAPKGYPSDGASIPKVFHTFYHPFTTESYWAAVVHDYLYSHLYYKFSKEFADCLFKFMIERDGGSGLMANTFYRAVRLNWKGGGWNE